MGGAPKIKAACVTHSGERGPLLVPPYKLDKVSPGQCNMHQEATADLDGLLTKDNRPLNK